MSEERSQSRLIEAESRAVKCAECGLPSIEIRAGMLIVRNRHHGQVHENSFSLQWLKTLLEQDGQDVLSSAGAPQ